MPLLIPGRLSGGVWGTAFGHVLMSEQRDHREQGQQGGGTVLWMAISDQCRWVSKPRRWRTSWKVGSICQRLTNQEMICPGSTVRSVHSKAWGLNSSCGSRINTQRNGTAGKPVLYQTAVAEITSTVRSWLPYQPAIVTGSHSASGSAATTERFATRSPLRRGRPN
jgi:hypothetical protein